MINIFRRPKWLIHYVDEIGAPKKAVIISAKTISLVKERFKKYFHNKMIVKVMMV